MVSRNTKISLAAADSKVLNRIIKMQPSNLDIELAAELRVWIFSEYWF